MNYYQLKSIMSSGKSTFTIKSPSSSFFVEQTRKDPYIEPSFEKVAYDKENPSVILISAVGATGKSTLAQVLSYDLRLPILDLGKHKAVGDNTLTGLLTGAYDLKEMSDIFLGLQNGSFGIIIDGVDEGRSKITDKGFEAFLDDIAKLCQNSTKTSFVLLGRTQIIDDCWVYLSDKGINVGLITISPFSIESARKYIDTFTGGGSSSFAQQYSDARDYIISSLNTAFLTNSKSKPDEFLTFIGYPPVLDAIVTLLIEEKNYFKLLEDLQSANGNDVEISLLYRIASYILRREREAKIIPNIVNDLAVDLPDDLRTTALQEAFSFVEQSKRLVAYCLGDTIRVPPVPDQVFNGKYEAQLETFINEHPFLSGRAFRNAVFEAVMLAFLMAQNDSESERLVSQYMSTHKHSYHLVYMVGMVSCEGRIKNSHINILMTAAMEFRSAHSSVEIALMGDEWCDEDEGQQQSDTKDLELEITLRTEQGVTKIFSFLSQINSGITLRFGPRLAESFITVPCDVEISGSPEIELISPVDINARNILVSAKSLVIRSPRQKGEVSVVVISGSSISSQVDTITPNGISFVLATQNKEGLSYPAIRYARDLGQRISDPSLMEKYLRLKRIFLNFRSHSKGALARIKDKIESKRVLKNDTARKILEVLLQDGVLYIQGPFYFVDQQKFATKLGITWPELRYGVASDKLLSYLKAIK